MEVSGVFSSWETLLYEICLLSRKPQLAVQVGHDQPTADADRQHQQADQQAECQPDCPRGLGEVIRMQEIRGHFPMRQGFADLRGHKRPAPIGGKG